MACTLQAAAPQSRRCFTAHARLIALAACPVAPAHAVVEALVELAVLEVTLGHEACAAGAVDTVVEVDHASGSGGTHRLVLVHSSDGAASGVIVRKVKGGVPGVLKTATKDMVAWWSSMYWVDSRWVNEEGRAGG